MSAREKDSPVGKIDTFELLCAIIDREMQCPTNMQCEYAKAPKCPHCRSQQTIKRGHNPTGKQRYQCKACNRSFSFSTGRSLSSTHIPRDTWLLFAECHLSKKSLRETAHICNISLTTAFHMRKRLSVAVSRYTYQIKLQMQKIRHMDNTR